MTLLPANSSPLENTLDDIQAQRELPVEIGKLWNPDTCPEALLPWLAWSLSVDKWDPVWDAKTKRNAIKASAKIHKHKGTVGAVKAALSSLGVSIKFVEWFDDVDDISLAEIQDTRPHHFAFIAWANENPYVSEAIFLNPELYQAIKQITENTKPLRSHFNFLVGAKLESGLLAGAITQSMQVRRTSNQTIPVQIPEQHTKITSAMTISNKQMTVARFYMK